MVNERDVALDTLYNPGALNFAGQAVLVADATRAGPAGLIFNIMRFALHDGPGIRTTVFFKGCPLSCWWCHNPESQRLQPELMYFPERCVRCGSCVEVCPEHAITTAESPTLASPVARGREGGAPAMITSDACRACGTCEESCPADAREIAGKWMRVDEVLTEVEKDAVFFDESGGGVTLSGGEPLMQPEFAEALLAACRRHGIHTVVDTCGLVRTDVLLCIAKHVDLFLFDLKLLDPVRHERYAGVDNEAILQNLKALARAGHQVVIRFPVIPGINDGEDDVTQMIAFLSGLGLRRIDLLPYHKIGMDKYHRLKIKYRLEGVEPPSEAQIQALAQRFRCEGFTVRIGG